MIPEVNIISKKASIASINRAKGSQGHSELLSRGFRGQSFLRKFLGSKEHLDLLTTDLNVANIITVQDHKCKKLNVNRSTHIQC